MRRTPLLLLSAAITLSLAGPALAGAEIAVVAQGPGTLFPTAEAAAVDGLAFAYSQQRARHNKRLSRGGTVMAVDGGYTYDGLITARPAEPDQLRVRLDERAVAHFHTYPAQHTPIDRRNETHSPGDRAVVDVHDKGHRPSYVLTPSLRIVAYHGRSQSEDRFVASLKQPLEEQMLAGR